MKIGLIGLPRTGKTSLFNLLTGQQVATSSYGSPRGEMHVGVARVPDARVDRLTALFKPKKTTFATFEVVDLAGLARGERDALEAKVATQSFHETKNFTCGEGGALLINDPQYTERAEIIWEKGTDRSRFFRGQVDKYTWVDVGSSFLPSDLLAAYLFAQLEAKQQVLAARKAIFDYYLRSLADWAEAHDVQLPIVPARCEQPYHMFYMVLPSLSFRQALIKHLRDQNIQSVFHYLPLHLAPMGRKYGYASGDCPITERVSDCLVRLPFYNDLTNEDQARVVAAIKSFAW